MQELSMNILDIAENSVRAGATLIEISLAADTVQNRLALCIKDNGCGMDAQTVARVTDPFVTSRTTRKVGLGLPFLKMAAEMTGGGMAVASEVGKGTAVTATFTLGHIDLMPLGDIGGTVSALAGANPGIDFVFTYQRDAAAFIFDTREAKQLLDDVPLSAPQVMVFIKDHVNEGVEEAARAGA